MTGFELAVVFVAMLLGAVVKGAIGMGFPMIAIPVMATFIGAEEAIVVMAIPTMVTNLWLLWNHRAFASETRNLRVLVVSGAVGATAGVWALSLVPAGLLMLVLAAVVLGYLVLFLSRPAFELSPSTSRWLSPPVGAFAGALQGATGISGPVVSTFGHALRMPRRAFLFHLTAQMQVFALVQVLGFVALDFYTGPRLVSSVLAILPAFVGLPAGMWLSSRFPRSVFERVVLGFLGLVAVKLVFDGLAQL